MTAEPSHDESSGLSPLLNPKTSLSSEDDGGGGDISVASSGTQKRFSFYNAQDYQVKAQQQQQQEDEPSNPNRFRFYDANEIAKEERTEQRQHQPKQQTRQQQQSSSRENAQKSSSSSSSSSDLDSSQILRSLQEHEQQRLEILGGSSSTMSAPIIPAAAAAAATTTKTTTTTTTMAENPSGLETPANYQQQQQQPRAASYASKTSTASTNTNPYEDAIKEALELLRRHRSSTTPTTLSAPNTPHSFSSQQHQYAMPSPLASDVGREGGSNKTTRSYSTATSEQTFQTQQQQQQQQRFKSTSTSSDNRALHDLVKATTAMPTRELSPLDEEILQARASWEAPSSSEQQQQQRQQTTTPSSVIHSMISPPPPQPTSPLEDGAASSIVLGDAYQAEIEARRKQRQERMARYASRLAELKQDTISPTGSTAAISSSLSVMTGTATSKHATAAAAAAQSWSSTTHTGSTNSNVSGGASTTSSSYNSHMSQPKQQQQQPSVKEEDVQRGVERVLLAILERANSRGRFSQPRGGGDDDDEEKKSTDLVLLQTRSSNMSDASSSASNKNVNDDDALLRAMSELLQQSSSMQTGSMDKNNNNSDGLLFADDRDENDNKDHVDEQLQQHTAVQQPQQHQQLISGDAETAVTQDSQTLAIRPVGSDPEAHQELDRMVERIFNEPTDDILEGILDCKEDEDRGSNDHQVVNDANGEDQAVEVTVEPTRGVSKESISREASDGSEVFSQEDEKESEDEYTADEEEEDDSLEEGETGDESYGGDSLDESETGDESYEDDDDDDDRDDDDDDDDESENDSQHRKLGVLGPLSMMAGGTTGVVLEGSLSGDSEKQPSIFEAAFNLVTGGDTSSRPKDKYAAQSYESDDDSESDSSSSSASANSQGTVQELTRTLCAHLFPRGHSDYAELQSRIPKWDESNGDEPGYRIIRLHSGQLDTVEREFEHVLRIWKKNASTDESFERDLKEAEDLLEQEELRSKASEPDTAPTINGLVPSAAGPNDIQCLEQFPGVKPAGKGEMGDLEYFHLPIIFKSHVTGFEPTKDIHLEPGNIIAGQYMVEGELGSAAFSTAYRCIDLNSEGGDGPDGHDEVCLKVIKNTKDFFDQSLDEIKILELLRQTGKCHENHILEMKTFFYHREHLMIVTELLRQNLFEFGKFIIDNDEEPYFTIRRLSYVTRQVLIAMKFIHNIGLVHSDVKPENILLSSYSRAQVKLIDFGSSCYLTDRQSSYIQSRSYRAPEVVLGLPYDGRIDIWSLGCVVAEMFTGEVTFQNDSVVSMLSRIEAICGKFPDHMIEQGRQSAAFFTRCGLLFEKVDRKKDDSYHDDSSDEDKNTRGRPSYDIFQPKRTTLAARLGFNKDLMEMYDTNQSLSHEQKRQAVFVDFVRALLTIDPEKRPSAEEALKHPWMEYAAALTEEDIQYPSG